VKTHGIWSSHFAAAGKDENAAYDVSQATVKQHAVWWLWPNTCLLRYPGRGNFMVFQVFPAGPGPDAGDLGLLLRDGRAPGRRGAVCALGPDMSVEMIAGRVAGGATVEFRPSGASMVPLIRSRQLVTVAHAVDGIARPRLAGKVRPH
jgi:hypothetical protein